MFHTQRLLSSLAVSGLALSSLMISGCASEKPLQMQTQPLQDQITRLEQQLTTSGEANVRAAQSQNENLATRQAALEKQLAAIQASLESMHLQAKARDAISEQQKSRIDVLAEALATKVGSLEKILSAASDQTRSNASQVATAQTRLDAATGADNALDTRLNLAEQRLNTLSGLVQEALALAAKDLFLANGKEAFTALLTNDKVIYPQNDPNLDPRDAAMLDELANRLGKLDQEYHLDIQGHTANNSTEDNNYNLGKARAEVVKRYLHEKKGISLSRMSAISYGANKPQQPAGGNNRRIFVRVLVLK